MLNVKKDENAMSMREVFVYQQKKSMPKPKFYVEKSQSRDIMEQDS